MGTPWLHSTKSGETGMSIEKKYKWEKSVATLWFPVLNGVRYTLEGNLSLLEGVEHGV